MTWTTAGLVTHFGAPPAPETTILRDVELVRLGTWASALSGTVPVDEDDFASMVAAAQDPEVNAAPVRIGHIDPRFDGEPALGWLTNVRRNGDRIVSDITDVPVKLAGVIQSAFRRRSVDIAWNLKTPGGKTYKAALAGLALLGVTPPAVTGLADVLARYSGVAPTVDSVMFFDDIEDADAARAIGQFAHLAAGLSPIGGVRGTDLHTRPNATDPTGGPMLTDEQIRALFGLAADAPITDQIRAAAPLVAAAQPPAAPSAPAAPVVPLPGPGILTAPGGTGGGEATLPPAATAPTPPVPAPVPPSTGATPPAVTPPSPAPAQGPSPANPQPAAGGPAPTPAPQPELVTLSAGNLAALQAQAAQGADAMRIIQEQERERVLTSALSGGKFAPGELDQWRSYYNAAPDLCVKHLAGMAAVFPTQPVGYDGNTAALSGGTGVDLDAEMASLYEQHGFDVHPDRLKKG